MLSIIGCGNTLRSDDGVAYHVLQRLAAEGLSRDEGISLFDATSDGLAVMFRARGSDELIIIDACTSGGKPGAVYRLPGAELIQRAEEGINLHAFRWDHALYAGQRMFGDDFPQRVTVYLVEAQDLQPGLELSPPVAAAVPTVAADIQRHIEEFDDAC